MRQIRVTKRRPGPANWPQTPLPPDARDPDIVRAHQITRRAGAAPRPDEARPRRPAVTCPAPPRPPA